MGRPTRYPKELIEEAKKMYLEGFSIRVIAAELLISEYQVRYHCDENRKKSQNIKSKKYAEKNRDKISVQQTKYFKEVYMKIPENAQRVRAKNRLKSKEKWLATKADPKKHQEYLAKCRANYHKKMAELKK